MAYIFRSDGITYKFDKLEHEIGEVRDKQYVDGNYFSKQTTDAFSKNFTGYIELRRQIMSSCLVGEKTNGRR
ncbi:MAG: hypothetical protein EPO02_14065 [Nitrospirae bacterium]|nr:MAG: hypothetical protein EPO02_14065 [Nitrospirota bacterium]